MPGSEQANGGLPGAIPFKDTSVPEGGTATTRGTGDVCPTPPRFRAATTIVAVPLTPGAVPGGITHGANPAYGAPSSADGVTNVVVTDPIVTLTMYAHTHAVCVCAWGGFI